MMTLFYLLYVFMLWGLLFGVEFGGVGLLGYFFYIGFPPLFSFFLKIVVVGVGSSFGVLPFVFLMRGLAFFFCFFIVGGDFRFGYLLS